jgi:hypothetical protein
VNRARAIWQYGEPIHAITYYSPERPAATDALGLKGGWMSYFGCRAAPLGAASAPTVTALLYVFHPAMVGRAIPDAWSLASPSALLDARLASMDAALRRVLGDDVVSSDAMRRGADIAAMAVSGCDMAGRPMGAGNQALPESDEPHLRLWQALTSIREYRGDGHIGLLVEAGVSPPQALVLQAATARSPEDGLRANRGWPDDDWAAAAESLAARGLVDDERGITPAGDQLRRRIEDDTDRLTEPLVRAIGDETTDQLIALLRPLAHAVMAAEAVPAHNNMGFPWPPTV